MIYRDIAGRSTVHEVDRATAGRILLDRRPRRNSGCRIDVQSVGRQRDHAGCGARKRADRVQRQTVAAGEGQGGCQRNVARPTASTAGVDDDVVGSNGGLQIAGIDDGAGPVAGVKSRGRSRKRSPRRAASNTARRCTDRNIGRIEQQRTGFALGGQRADIGLEVEIFVARRFNKAAVAAFGAAARGDCAVDAGIKVGPQDRHTGIPRPGSADTAINIDLRAFRKAQGSGGW